MQRGRRFSGEAEAVSPVLAVALSVAIIIVLAGALAFMVQVFLKQPAPTPKVAFTRQGATVEVLSAPQPPLDWFSDLRPGGTCFAAGHLRLTPNGRALGPYPAAAGTRVASGDVLSGCLPGESLVLSHIATNRVMFQATF